MVRVFARNMKARGFDFRPFHFHQTHASVTKQCDLVPVNGRRRAAAGKVTVGLASHWPCVTDFSGLSAYTGSRPTEEEMSTPPALS